MSTVREILEVGLRHQQAGRLPEADRCYREALALDRNNPDGLHLLGLLSHQIGRNEQAVDLIAQAIVQNDRIALYYSNLGLALAALGRRADAIARQWQALALDPDLLQAHMLLVEALLPGEHYHGVLRRLHERLKPRVYVEIGVETGASLALAQPPTVALGIDPAPRIGCDFTADTQLFRMTSEAFFAGHDISALTGCPGIDLAFIDGLHTFDQALRDFVDIERLALPGSVVLVHDCMPLSAPTATREQHTRFWSGDTWKLVPLLKRHRPDLTVRTIACPPTGLAVITGLDPRSTTLADRRNALIAEFVDLPFEYLRDDRDTKLNVIANDWPVVDRHLAQALGAGAH
jgi:tetratricopeptide (TPR) repeat protein